MRFIELLVTSLIASFISVAVIFSFTAGKKGTDRILDTAGKSTDVLIIDGNIRKEIANIDIPYWRNPEKYLREIGFDLHDLVQLPDGAEILKTESVKDGLEYAIGMDVVWIFDGKEYETKESFR